MTLLELRKEYPLRSAMKYEPSEHCTTCSGGGEETQDDGSKKPCICVYVGFYGRAPSPTQFRVRQMLT